MKVLDRTIRGKADVVRQTRMAAQTNKSRSKIYRRIERWEENNIGTDNEEYVITLKVGWSFLKEDHLTTKIFSSVGDAMRGMREVRKCGCDSCKENDDKILNKLEKQR